MKNWILVTVGALAIAGCSIKSPVTDAGDGTYLNSVKSAPLAGGAAGAHRRASEDAEKFCATKGDGLHAVIVDDQKRVDWTPVYGNRYVTASAMGVSALRFRCERTGGEQ